MSCETENEAVRAALAQYRTTVGSGALLLVERAAASKLIEELLRIFPEEPAPPSSTALALLDAPPPSSGLDLPLLSISPPGDGPCGLRVGMTYEEVGALDFELVLGKCPNAGPRCSCLVCNLVESLVCRCGVAFIDHGNKGACESSGSFSLASWTTPSPSGDP